MPGLDARCYRYNGKITRARALRKGYHTTDHPTRGGYLRQTTARRGATHMHGCMTHGGAGEFCV